MKHVLFILTSQDSIGTTKVKTGYEFSEVADAYLEFIQHGISVDFASIKGGKPPEDGYDESYPNNRIFKNSSGFLRLNYSHPLSDIHIDAYDAIYFPGGLGPMGDMQNNSLVKNCIKTCYERGKIISAVCHGIVALLNVSLENGQKLLEKRAVTCFTEAEEIEKKHHVDQVIPFLLDEAIINEGAHFSSSPPFIAHIVRDGNLITGQNPASAQGVAKEVIKQLQTNSR